MSRTYRRKGVTLPKWITHDWVTDEGLWNWRQVKYTGDKLIKVLARQRSDKGFCIDGNNVPKYFRQDLNRHFRTKMKQEVKRINREADYDEYEFTPHRQTAAWDWW